MIALSKAIVTHDFVIYFIQSKRWFCTHQLRLIAIEICSQQKKKKEQNKKKEDKLVAN